MTRSKTKKRAMVILALTLALLIPAPATATTVAPRAQVVLSGEHLTLADVFTGITAHGEHILAPAPQPGREMVLQRYDLMRIATAFNLPWQAPDTPVQSIVTRAATLVDGFKIEAALQEEMATVLAGRKFELQLDDRDDFALYVTDDVQGLKLTDVRTDINRGTFTARLVAGASSRNLSGKITPLTEVAVLSRAVAAGEVIAAADVTYIDVRDRDLGAQTIINAEQLVGMTPRRGLAPMRLVTAGEVTAPLLVKRGDLVTMTLQNGIVHLTVQGRALENGAAGGVVRVINTSSNQVVEAAVTGARQVSVTAPAPPAGNI